MLELRLRKEAVPARYASSADQGKGGVWGGGMRGLMYVCVHVCVCVCACVCVRGVCVCVCGGGQEGNGWGGGGGGPRLLSPAPTLYGPGHHTLHSPRMAWATAARVALAAHSDVEFKFMLHCGLNLREARQAGRQACRQEGRGVERQGVVARP